MSVAVSGRDVDALMLAVNRISDARMNESVSSALTSTQLPSMSQLPGLTASF